MKKGKGKLKAWLKTNGKNALGTALDTIGEATNIPIASKLIESIGEQLMDDPDLSEDQKQEVAELIKLELQELDIIESNLTERHKNDMLSDSWLSKNVRPLVVFNFTLLIDVVILMAIWDKPIDLHYLGLIEMLGITVLGGYFTVRTIEKRNKKKYL